MSLVVLTGMSGSGKSTALKAMEDIGYYCVDNLPVELLYDLVRIKGGSDDKTLVGIDIRGGDKTVEELWRALDIISQEGFDVKILFLDSSDDILLTRYKETRRNHPLSGEDPIMAGIERERAAMLPLRQRADYIIDTSHLLTRELKAELDKIFIKEVNYKSLFVTVMSFGFKYGIPDDADIVLDVRFMPNPYYDLSLRPLTGMNQEIEDFVMNSLDSRIFLDKCLDMIRFLIPQYIKEGKNRLVIAFGCTGGKHRSVTMAKKTYQALEQDKTIGLKLENRDITKDAARGK